MYVRGYCCTAAIDTPLGELSNLLKLNEQELKFYMQRFAKIDSNKDGRVDLAGFEEGLQTQPGNDYVRQLFEMFGAYSMGPIVPLLAFMCSRS